LRVEQPADCDHIEAYSAILIDDRSLHGFHKIDSAVRNMPHCLTSSVEAYTARLVHLFPLAEHVCCRLSEDQDQFHEISRFHLVA
jgi:hypothetical protein